MDLPEILTWLNHTNPIVRRQTAIVLGVVYEHEAINPLYKTLVRETDEENKQVFKEMINRLENTKIDTVLNRIFAHFQIDQEIANLPENMDFNEVELLDQMNRQFREDLSKQVSEQSQKIHSFGMKTGNIGSSQMSALNASNDLLGAQNNLIKKRRIPAMQPNPDSPKYLMARLAQTESEPTILSILRELVQFNNPHVLPTVAEIALSHPSANVRVGAERATQELYLMMRYWNLTQNGMLQVEYSRRIKAKK